MNKSPDNGRWEGSKKEWRGVTISIGQKISYEVRLQEGMKIHLMYN